MLPLGHRIAFGIFALVTLTFGARGFSRLYMRVARGRRDPEDRTDRTFERLWYALRTTVTQERVFRRRPTVGIFHSFIFYAFGLYLVVNAVDALDGYVQMPHVVPAVLLTIYGLLTDGLSVLAIFGTFAFVVRRFASQARRDFLFNEKTLLHEKVQRGYIRRDSIIVYVFILLHIASRVVANAARLATEGAKSSEPLSSFLAPLFAGPHATAWRIAGYWGALGSVLLFFAYFPYTKHIHLIAAPIKYFLRRRALTGELPFVHIDLEATSPEIGASSLADLSQARLLDAYACIQCNRCQDVCPASLTGKALSPSALEINKRMVLNGITEQVSAFSLTGTSAFESGGSSGPLLLEAVISPESVWACTTCGACMEVCPTQDEQMLDIIEIRRNQVMLQGLFPSQLQNAFRGMERSSNPWAISSDKRMDWARDLDVPTIETNPNPEVLYWVGCAASYDPSAQKTARAVVQLLAEAKVNFAVLGKRECCTGDSARRAGNELLYQALAGRAISELKEAHPKLVLASCPHCVNTIASEFPQLGGYFQVMHHTEYLASLVDKGQLEPLPSESTITYHDPCYLGRHRGTYDPPRSLLNVLTDNYVDLPRTKRNAFCCGAGGAQFWKEEEPGRERVSDNRFREVQQTLAATESPKILAVGCPFCKSMLQSTPAAGDDDSIAIQDVAELLWEGVQRSQAVSASSLKSSESNRTLPSFSQGVAAAETAAIAETFASQNSDNIGAPFSGSREDLPSPGVKIVAETSANAGLSDSLLSVRKKWNPRGPARAQVTTPKTGSVAIGAASQVKPDDLEQPEHAARSERKRWSPKDSLASDPGEPSAGSGAAETETSDSTAPKTRKKWQPGGSR